MKSSDQQLLSGKLTGTGVVLLLAFVSFLLGCFVSYKFSPDSGLGAFLHTGPGLVVAGAGSILGYSIVAEVFRRLGFPSTKP
jgi:hypothetical protein